MPKKTHALAAFAPAVLRAISERASFETRVHDASNGSWYEWHAHAPASADVVRQPSSSGRMVRMSPPQAELLSRSWWQRIYGGARGGGGKRPDVEREVLGLGAASTAFTSLAHDGARRSGRRI